MWRLIYHTCQAACWALVVGSAVLGGEHLHPWDRVAWLLPHCQALALLEVAPAALGPVRADVVITLAQVLSRVAVVALCQSQPLAARSAACCWFITAWCAMELVRHPFHALSQLGHCPRWLRWLRHNAFVILYPIGVAGEFGSFVAALPRFPHPNLIWWGVLPTYLFGLPLLCGHTLLQRTTPRVQAQGRQD